MKDILEKLCSIQGVVGCAVYDGSDNCLAHAAPEVFEPILFTRVIGELQEAFNLYRSIEASASLSTFIARFEDGYLDVRWVNGHAILTMAKPSVNTAMLNVGLNAAALKLSKVLAGEPVPASGSGVVVKTPPPLPSVGDSRRMGSGLSISPGSRPDQLVPPDAVGLSVVNALVKLLAQEVGPFAKVHVKNELAKLGVSAQTVGRGQFLDLIGMVAKKIPDVAKQRDFVAAAKALL